MGRPIDVLWEQACAGDPRAYAEFYERHADRVYGHCLAHVRSAIDAQDLTAEVFVITWARRGAIVSDPDADILPWLLGTANTLIRQYHSTMARTRRLMVRIGRPEHHPDFSEQLVNVDATERDVQLALTVMSRLRSDDQDVIRLCIMQGLSPSTVATIYGVASGTIRTRLSRALARARAAYRDAAAAIPSEERRDGAR